MMAVRVPDPEVQPVMTPAEIASVFGASMPTIYDWIKSGEIPSIRLGRKIVIPTAAVRKLLGLDDNSHTADDPEAA